MANQEVEKKKFQVPNKEDLVIQIKGLDEEIQHISLNLVRCKYEATQADVIKAFPQFTFIKVKNYNPGSFELVFQLRIDAINFIRTCYDKKILNQRFFIKLGRQSTQTIEDWAFVGYVPRNFQQNKRQNVKKSNKGKYEPKNHKQENQNMKKKQIAQNQEKQPQNKEQKQDTVNKNNQKTEQSQKLESNIVQVKKKQQQNIVQIKKKQPAKKQQENLKNKSLVHQKIQSTVKQQSIKQVQKFPSVEQKVEKIQIVEQKKQKQQPNKIQENNQKKKKNKKGQQKTVQPKQEHLKQQTQKLDDDGWIVVKAKNKKK